MQGTEAAPYTNQGFAGLVRAMVSLIIAVPINILVPICSIILTPFALLAEKAYYGKSYSPISS